MMDPLLQIRLCLLFALVAPAFCAWAIPSFKIAIYAATVLGAAAVFAAYLIFVFIADPGEGNLGAVEWTIYSFCFLAGAWMYSLLLCAIRFAFLRLIARITRR